MANLNPSRRSVLIGSSGMLFTDQMAVDIYFQDYWHPGPVDVLSRVAVVCVGWGLSIAVVQNAPAHQPGDAAVWTIDPLALNEIVVQNLGVRPFAPPAPLPHIPPGQPLPAVGGFIVNGEPTHGHIMPWHYRVGLRRAEANQPLHYHQHFRRKNHTSPPPPINPDGSHKVLRLITYSTQVQNYRHGTVLAE
ncbi:hypothetical protein FKP32DRAFT_1594893 [Trametes sanguinea]|nr:hypothetical protein FKP32DRAFT_1594893 [Trametes sanguinea]